MYQIGENHLHQQSSPTKIQKDFGNCFNCHKSGHWAKDCPDKLLNRSPVSKPIATTSDPYFPSIHCRCGAGLCKICVSGSTNNPGRKYYRCPEINGKNCGNFMWCDNPRKKEIPKSQPNSFPTCGCGAGVSILLIEESGPNAGSRYFGCHIKKGEGACNFKQWLDNAPQSSLADDTGAEEKNKLDRFELSGGATQIDVLHKSTHELLSEDIQVQVQMEAHEFPVLEDDEQMSCEDTQLSDEAPEVNPQSVANISENTLHSELAKENSVMMQTRMDDSTTENAQEPFAVVVAAVGNPLSQDPGQQGKIVNTVGNTAIPDMTSFYTNKNSPFPHRDPFMVARKIAQLEEFSPDLDNFTRTRPHLNPPSLLKDRSDEASILTSTILQEFEKLAHRLQNDLITILESMDSHNHEIMMKEAECLFAALDCLQVEYGLFRVRVTEYITQAAALAQIEQTISKDASSQEKLQHYKNEKSRFDEISRAYCETKAALVSSSERLSLLRENSFCLKGMLDELATEISCCEVEYAAHQNNFLCMTKTMSECKDRLQVAYQEAAEALKLSDKREVLRNTVKAAFEKVRAQLRK